MTFKFYRDKKGEHRWRLVARNGRIVAESGEGYTSKAACHRMAERVATLQGESDALSPYDEYCNDGDDPSAVKSYGTHV